MEDFIEEILKQIAEGLHGLEDGIDVDSIIDNASDSLHQLMDNLSDASIGVNEDNKQLLVDKIMEAIGGDPNLIADNLAALTDSNPDWLSSGSDVVTTDVNLDTPANSGEISFGSAGCWDECIASVQDAGKRMTCGYHA